VVSRKHIVAYLLKAGTVKPEKQPLLGNARGIVTIRDLTRTAVAVDQLSKHARKSGRVVFSMWSAPRLLLCKGAVNTPPQQ
jgi:hypothetical protein